VTEGKRPPGAPPLRREAAKKERTFAPAGYPAPGLKGDISILPREGTFLFCLDTQDPDGIVTGSGPDGRQACPDPLVP
jgi:hypothetical protein